MRLRVDLAYEGTHFAGWARQPGQRTVQEVLESALVTVLRVPNVRAACAGRTDAGVHARGQVVHTDVPRAAYDLVARSLPHRLAGVLPPDVRAPRVEPAPPGFDARFSATGRRYAYRVSDSAYGVNPLRRHDVLWHRRALDVAAMNDAAALLVGEHDFAAFCRRRAGATTIRTLRTLQWSRDPDGLDGLLVATVAADAFCHNMVRALVGALLTVGEGRRPVSWPGAVLAARVRTADVHVVPPRGLTLEEVTYPDEATLAAQAQATRRRRAVTT